MWRTELVGWLSSFVLVLTIAWQVLRQWRSGQSEGVSPWLFVGQMSASAGFTVYSLLVHNEVFVVTNALLFVSAAAGLFIVRVHRRRRRKGAEGCGDARWTTRSVARRRVARAHYAARS